MEFRFRFDGWCIGNEMGGKTRGSLAAAGAVAGADIPAIMMVLVEVRERGGKVVLLSVRGMSSDL